MNAIGGYFELELRKGEEYHKNAIRLNTGRNALELILNVRKYKKVYIPYYTCDVIHEPFNKLGVKYEYYSIDKNFNPIFDYSKIQPDEGFLYTNYFGIKDTFINNLSLEYKNLIIDNSQAFFAKRLKNIDTFYSCRKFFGVPDGAYVYLNDIEEIDFPLDHSENRFAHLLKRIEYGPKAGFNDFKINEDCLVGQSIKQMSKITQAMLCNIDYNKVCKTRKRNFCFLNEQLSKSNEIELPENIDFVPMVYPYLVSKGKNLKQKLIQEDVFVATYWPNVLEFSGKDTLEYYFSNNILSLPIDQRYSKFKLQKVVDLILRYV